MMKDLPEDFAYCWTSIGDAPYNINTCIDWEENPGDFVITDSIKTYRKAESNNSENNVILSLQLGNFLLKNINNNSYPLEPEELDTDFIIENFSDALNVLFCDTIPRSNLYKKIALDYEVVFKNLLAIKANNSNNVSLLFKLIDKTSGNTLYASNSFVLPLDSAKRIISGNLIIPLNKLNQQYDLIVKLFLVGVAEEYLNQTENISLVNTYLSGGENLNKQNERRNNFSNIDEYKLEQNYPNPFNPFSTIKFELPKSSVVSLKVYDIPGREINELVNEFRTAGKYEVTFDASKLPSGVYFYRLQSENFVKTRKMVLIK